MPPTDVERDIIGTELMYCVTEEPDKGSYRYSRSHSLSGDLVTSAAVEKRVEEPIR